MNQLRLDEADGYQRAVFTPSRRESVVVTGSRRQVLRPTEMGRLEEGAEVRLGERLETERGGEILTYFKNYVSFL